MNIFGRKPRKTALVLGGGAARGLAHIGTLKVLEREEIPIDLIVGTSMGALIGAAYSLGVPIQKMEKLTVGLTWKDLFDPVIPKLSLLEGKKMASLIEQVLNEKTFLDAKTEMAVVTTDIEKAEEIVHTSGDLHKLIRASCSWPGIFNPVEIDGRLLVDGGIKNSVPVSIAKQMGATCVIAVDVGFCVTKDKKMQSILALMLQSFQIMGEELNTHQSRHADVLIEPDLGSIDQAAFHRSSEAISKGALAAENSLPNLRKKLKLKPKRWNS